MSWSHFEQMAADYASARPPYPAAIFDLLRDEGATGPGLRVLEVGAGAGLATVELVASGCEVVALEPGRDLGALLRQALPGVHVLPTRLEDADLPVAAFDSVVAATSLHWVDLSAGVPALHSTLRPGGLLAVFRTVFGDETVETEFRDRVRRIVAAREPHAESSPEWRPTMSELTAGGYFRPVRSERWRWSVEIGRAHV